MTNDNGLDHDSETLRLGVFAEWKAEHPEGTREEFDAEWAVITSCGRAVQAPPATTSPTWEREAEILKHRFFEEWIAHRPGATRAQFEDEWRAIKADYGL